MKSVRVRFYFLFLTVVTVFLGAAIWLHISEERHANMILTDMEQRNSDVLQRIIGLKSHSIEAFAYDYSYWDDMVKFLTTGDSAWGVENIDASLATYKASAVWVLDKDFFLVREADTLISDTLTGLLESKEALRQRLARSPMQHYFQYYHNNLWELYVDPIQPTADLKRVTPARGYFVVGRQWNEKFLAELARDVGGEFKLVPAAGATSDWKSSRQEAVIRYADTLRSSDSSAVAVLRGQVHSGFLRELIQAQSQRSLLVLALCVALLALLGYSLQVWVIQPIHTISKALTNGDAGALSPLKDDQTEFGYLANLVKEFFSQKDELIKEVQERTAAQQALTESAKRIESLLDEQRMLLENTRDFIYRHDIYGVFHYVSPSLEAVTGYTQDEWLKHYTTYLTDNAINSRVVNQTEETLANGTIFPPYLVEIFHKQGHRILLEISEQPYFANGKVSGIIGVARDITERWRSEQEHQQLLVQLEKAQRMESLAVLAGGVAHDLNNTLGPLVAYPEVILEELPDDSPGRIEIEAMGKAASQAAAIIQDLLTLARRGRYDMKSIQMNDIINAYLASPNFIDLKNRNPNVTVELSLKQSLAPVQGSATHLSTVLMNLVVNAFDAMPDGGRLAIDTCTERVSSVASIGDKFEPGEYTIVRVSDSGIGISQEDLDKIFEPYYSKKKMGRSGSGLGLSIVYGIVKDHKAFYDIISSPGKGTQFSLLFPVLKDAPAWIPTARSYGSGTETILVVDDLEDQRQMACYLLKTLGYKIVTAGGAAEALRYLAKFPVDLVILDMIMEGDLDGLETYRRILEMYPTQKAIVVSGYSATERVEEIRRLGVREFVRKPYTRDDLAGAVRRELDRTPAAVDKSNEEVPAPLSFA
ncbi:MAG TPA: ATP-binding protein [Candidatus Acidoferrum sp.]|nr:ATP-binding protein [Candidatus Acidoferrum sp.]